MPAEQKASSIKLTDSILSERERERTSAQPPKYLTKRALQLTMELKKG